MKVVINSCFGGFGLSPEAEIAYLARKGKQAFFYENVRGEDGHIDFGSYRRLDDPRKGSRVITYTLTEDLGLSPSKDAMNASEAWFTDRDIPRDDPDLVAVVEELGDKAAGRFASLSVVEVPDDAAWEIAEYDGLEHVAETHRTWA